MNGEVEMKEVVPPSAMPKDASLAFDEETVVFGKEVDGVKGDGAAAEKKAEDDTEDLPKVSCCEMFRFADSYDVFLMTIGTIGAIGAGGTLPLFSYVFGDVMNALNAGSGNIMDSITTLCLYFLYLGIGMFFCSWLEIQFWMMAAGNQAERMRAEYLRALMRQEIAWHDGQKAGAITTKLTGDTRQFQEAIGDKFGTIIHHASTFLAAFGKTCTSSNQTGSGARSSILPMPPFQLVWVRSSTA